MMLFFFFCSGGCLPGVRYEQLAVTQCLNITDLLFLLEKGPDRRKEASENIKMSQGFTTWLAADEVHVGIFFTIFALIYSSVSARITAEWNISVRWGFFLHPETADIGDRPWRISARCTRDILPVSYAEKLLHYRYDIDKESVYIKMTFQLQFEAKGSHTSKVFYAI